MSENMFTKRVSTLPMLSSKCSHDNLNLTLHDFAWEDRKLGARGKGYFPTEFLFIETVFKFLDQTFSA